MAAAKTERLLNLVIALLSTRRALPRAVIRDKVAAYREAANDEAFERMFERDKDELRELGIPLVTEDLDDFFEDEPGYRIDRQEYALPELEMTHEQLSLLSLAGRTWSEASLGGAAARALRKLESVVPGGEGDPGESVLSTGLDRIETGVRTSEPAFEAVRAAVVAARPVRFSYRRRGAATTTRHVQPWGFAAWHGHWYLTGHDVDRGEPRVFRLDRIEGDVTPAGAPGSYDIPEDHDPRAVVESSFASGDPVQAHLRVRPGRGHGLRGRSASASASRAVASAEPDTFGTRKEWDVVQVEVRDLRSFADEIVGYGADVVVDAPPELREAVVARLRAVLAAHGGAA